MKHNFISHKKSNANSAKLGDDIAVYWDNKHFYGIYEPNIPTDNIVMSICTGGQATVVINEKKQDIKTGVLNVRTTGYPFLLESTTNDYSCWEIVISWDAIKNLPFDTKSITTALVSLWNNPCFELCKKQQVDFLNMAWRNYLKT